MDKHAIYFNAVAKQLIKQIALRVFLRLIKNILPDRKKKWIQLCQARKNYNKSNDRVNNVLLISKVKQLNENCQ